MLRFIHNNCGANDNSRHFLQQILKFKTFVIKKSIRNSIQPKSCQNASRNSQARSDCSSTTPKYNVSNIKVKLLGSSGISLGLIGRNILQQSKNNVQCDGNRLAGIIQGTLQQDGKFDWRRFWSYLEPHLWEFFGAIAIVLRNFTLTLRPGDTVALVGASGSGKSTVACLVERFYEPSSGSIKIDGYKLEDISPSWLRANVLGFIEQQPVLFATTILENIRYGRPESKEEDVHSAAKLSQSHDFVTALPEGYHTNVGERGTQLSGGQRQRIAIARALLKNPKILILDEATSALDASSEAEVQKALNSAILNRTTLVIAHRLSTIRNADLIVVLDRGSIVESGNHNDLMSKRGIYFDLVRQQEKCNSASLPKEAANTDAAVLDKSEGNKSSFTYKPTEEHFSTLNSKA